MAVGVGQVADLIDAQQVEVCVVAQPAVHGRGAVKGSQLAEQGTGAGKEHRVAPDWRLVGDVAGDGGFADTVGAEENGVGRLGHEGKVHQLLDGRAIAAGGPSPV